MKSECGGRGHEDLDAVEQHVATALSLLLRKMLCRSEPATRARILIGWTHILLRKFQQSAATKARAKRLDELDAILEYSRKLVELSLGDHAEREAVVKRSEPTKALRRLLRRKTQDVADNLVFQAFDCAINLQGPNGEWLDGCEYYAVNKISLDMLQVLVELVRAVRAHPNSEWKAQFGEDDDETEAVFLLCAELARGWFARYWMAQRDAEAREKRRAMVAIESGSVSPPS